MAPRPPFGREPTALRSAPRAASPWARGVSLVPLLRRCVEAERRAEPMPARSSQSRAARRGGAGWVRQEADVGFRRRDLPHLIQKGPQHDVTEPATLMLGEDGHIDQCKYQPPSPKRRPIPTTRPEASSTMWQPAHEPGNAAAACSSVTGDRAAAARRRT